MKFVIIGGDAAGMSAASRAKRTRPDMDVSVLEQTMDVSYSACGMPYNIADPTRLMDDLVVRHAQVFIEKQGIDLRTGHRVEAIDRDTQEVIGTNIDGREFKVSYDRLMMATGASPIEPDPSWFEFSGVKVLKSLQHGQAIKAFIQSKDVKKVVIIGMGFIALEMCEALMERGLEVEMVKPRPDFLPWMNRELASVVKDELEKNGVEIHLGKEIKGIERQDNMLRVICPDMTIEGQMVLVAVGVIPNSDLAAQAGLELGPADSIAVDRQLKTSDERIYAAGDCSDAFHLVTGKKTWIPLALRANRGGWAVADNVTGKPVELEGIVGTSVFKVFDLQVARTGLSMSDAKKYGFDPVEIMIQARSRAHAHPGSSTILVQMVGDRKSGRLLGTQLVGKEGVAHRINAPAVALHQRITVEAFSQCDLAYTPPFGPVWDPMLTAANQLIKKM